MTYNSSHNITADHCEIQFSDLTLRVSFTNLLTLNQSVHLHLCHIAKWRANVTPVNPWTTQVCSKITEIS